MINLGKAQVVYIGHGTLTDQIGANTHFIVSAVGTSSV